ncbi:MAG: glycosyltransferase family 2 protein [Sphaerochaetaceae bacterium]|jgi:glycosyltransferase involved in cell wall biosynthesis
MSEMLLPYSVAMCTCNGERFVKEQLESILRQTVLPKEIVISDDLSTDNTLDIVETTLKESNVSFRILRNKVRLGVGNNFLQCIHQCSSPIVFTCDQDDVWLPQKAEQMLEVFRENPQALLVFSDGQLCDENGEPLHETIWHGLRISAKMAQAGDWFSYLLRGGYVTGAAMAIQKELSLGISTIPSPWLHDEWLSFSAAIKDGVLAYPEELFLYRQHGRNVMGMKKLGFWGHVKRWRNSLSEIQETRGIKLRYYQDLESAFDNELTKQQRESIVQCIRFLEESQGLAKKKKFARLTVIARNVLNKAYGRFSSGFFSVLRDFARSMLL